jgi:type I restriction enzyme S subunit
MRRVPLGDVLDLALDEVEVEGSTTYPIAGVYSFGRGVFPREPITGTETSYRRLNRLHSRRFVMSRLKAFEGAVAVVSEDLDGYFVSQEFPTFTFDEQSVVPEYFGFLCRWPEFWRLLSSASKGVGARRERVHPEQLFAVAIPLPDLTEQRRIVVRLEGLLGATSPAVELIRRATNLDNALTDSIVDAILTDSSRAGWPSFPLSEVATVNPSPSPVEGPVAFVPMSAVDEKLGKIADPEIRPIEDIKTGYKQFRRDDVIFARITPCMQNGKSAVVEIDGVEYGYGSTEFHVLRPSNKLLPEWLHRVVRSRGFRERAMQAFTGTAGQQRVPAGFLREARIAVPPIEDQRRLVAHIDRVLGLGDEVRRKRELELERAMALSSSVLNSAFTGLL